MSMRQLLRSVILMAGFASVAPEAQIQKPSFAILNLPSGVYLQMDVTGLSGSEEPVVDTARVILRDSTDNSDDGLFQVKATLMVMWSKVPLTVSSETKITEAQILRKLEFPIHSSCPTCNDTVRALRVDTIAFATPSSSVLWRQIAPPHINSLSLLPRMWCMIDYDAPFCNREKGGCRDMLVQQFIEAWKTKSYAAILEPSPIMTYVYVSPWSQTTGTEEQIAGIATASAGNAGNWIDVTRARLATRSVLKQPLAATSGTVPTILPLWNIPTGAVRYVYDRTASPEAKILETGDHRTVGSLLKIGSTMEVSRRARPRSCQPPLTDTTMGASSWLVLADSGSENALEQALTPTDVPFGPERSTAWRISGDTVWLDATTTIPLADLLAAAQAPAGVARHPASAGCRLSRTTEGFALELDTPAEVRIVSPGGQILSGWTLLPAGKHALPPTAGIAFAQVRAEGLRATLPLVR